MILWSNTNKICPRCDSTLTINVLTISVVRVEYADSPKQVYHDPAIGWSSQFVSCCLACGRYQVQFLAKAFVYSFDMEVSAKSSINNLVKIRDVLGVFRHAESKSSLSFGLSLFLKEVSLILCWNP